MKKLIPLLALIAILLIAASAANAFVDTFSDASSYNNWNDAKPWAVISNGMLTKTTPAGTEDYFSTKQLFTYGVFNVKFRTTTTPGTYAYMGWHGTGWTSANKFADPVAYMRLDANMLHLNVTNGAYNNGSALSAPLIVTPGVWHTLQMVWKAGSIEVSLDGVSGGIFSNENIPSTPMELALRTYNSKNTGDQVFEVDDVSVTPVSEPEAQISFQQKINGINVQLDTSHGIKLLGIGSGIKSFGGRVFGIMVGDRRIYSDEVNVRDQEIKKSADGIRIPFDLPDGLGSGVIVFAAGKEPGLIDANLTLKSNQSAKWRVLFPLIEKLTVDGIPQDKIEFFFPLQEGWLGRGLYDLSVSYGHRAWLPILAAWNPNGTGIAIQSRDDTFAYRSLRFRNASAEGNFHSYTPDYLDLVSAFPSDSLGLSMSVSPIGFDLASGDTWKSATSAIQIYNGKQLFKAPFKSYEKWARATWWKHRKTPDWLRDSFMSFAVQEHVGNAGFVRGLHDKDKFIASEQAQEYNKTTGGHPYLEWFAWWNHGEEITSGQYAGFFHPWVGEGDYNYEERWGGLPAYRDEIAKCHKAGARICLYLLGGSVWKTSRIGLEHSQDWGVMRVPGKVDEVWSGAQWQGITTEFWDICSEAVGWQQFLKNKAYQLLTETGADAVRLDTKAEALICNNPNHPHNADPLRGLLTYLQTVRKGVDQAGADKALMGEFAGSDAAAQYFDSTLAQGHDIDTPLVSQMTLYGISPFRYVYPEMKCIEWGNVPKDYHQTTRRMLFNGIGITVSDLNQTQLFEATRFTEAMRSVGDILGSLDCEALVDTLVNEVYANRFSLKGREVYTLWNQTGNDLNARLIKIPGDSNRRFVDLLTGKECKTLKVRGGNEVKLALPNNEVAIIGVFPKMIAKKVTSNTIVLSSKPGIKLKVYEPKTGKILAFGTGLVKVKQVNSPTFARAVRNGYLVEDIIELSR